MLSRGERNYLIGIILFITGFACLVTGIFLHIRPEFTIYYLQYIKPLHIWIGYVLSAVIVIHLLVHSGWITSTTKSLFSNKKKTLILVSVIVITIIICYLSAVWGPHPQHSEGKNRGKNRGYWRQYQTNSSSFSPTDNILQF